MSPRARWLLATACVCAVGALVVFLEDGAPPPGLSPVAEPAAAVPADAAPARLVSGTHPTPAGEENPREIAQQLERELTLQIERALVSQDAAAREAAFAFALPELLRLTPTAVIALVARQPAGEARDALRDEAARQWIRVDRDAAVEWLRSLPDADRSAGATVAMRSLAAASPPEAIRVAEELGVGRDDGSIDHLVRIWAESEPEAARRWLAARRQSAH
jgi:hypothetical protein